MEATKSSLSQPPRDADEMFAFEVGVQTVFASWTALVLAVEHEFGGSRSKDKAQVIFEDFLDLFYKRRENSDIEKLWEFLDQQLDDRLNLELEDNSIVKILEVIMQLYETCMKRDFTYLNQILQSSSAKKPIDSIWGGKKVTSWPPKEDKAPRVRPKVTDLAEDDSMGGASDSDDDGDNGDDMDENSVDDASTTANERQQEPESKGPDDDGWTTVGKKGKKK
jgi:pre-rRNA-processing protein TSR2